MKNITLFLLFLLCVKISTAQCSSAYSQASYALAHTKKSLSSDNFDHQKYYAGRAIDALEKAKTLVESCGCNDAVSPIIDGLDNLKQAEDPIDWEAGRFYAKHGYEFLQTLMTKLDVCTTNASSVSYETETSTADVASTEPAIATAPVEAQASSNSLLTQQQQLEAEKQRLMEQQRLLDEKIAKQQQLAEQARINRQLELEKQLRLKHLAEQALFDLENNYKELAQALGCQEALNVLKGGYAREDNVLNNETLAQTKAYYLNLTTQTEQKILGALNKCAGK
ncbi:hypothetical protein HX109_01230 [Galbibacter sp. BG1]|uniref:hypothetical protein n=1 Tax=Galbibacter sp. BG1 TaxID=1170699 RepID=UPI0015BF8B05|nr:hypothetical protein [Galbibacter sp. BG1]QLE00252.1 hypothetical protein HX109_01230 [Galbibacter sp. BG1]